MPVGDVAGIERKNSTSLNPAITLSAVYNTGHASATSNVVGSDHPSCLGNVSQACFGEVGLKGLEDSNIKWLQDVGGVSW